MIEDHQKGTLHYHFLLFGSLSPYLLHRFAALPQICQEISATLNVMFRASLPVNKHVRHLIPKILRNCNGFKLNPRSLGQLSPPAMFERDNPLTIFQPYSSSSQTSNLYAVVCDSTNNQAGRQAFHEHSKTCRKGLNGHTGCRLCKPSGSTSGTHPVLLNVVENEPITLEGDSQRNSQPKKSKYDYHVVDPIPALSSMQYSSINPSLPQQRDLIIWEMDRPVPIFQSNEYYTMDDLKNRFNHHEHHIRCYIIELFEEWLDNDTGYPESSPLWEWLEQVEFDILASFYSKLLDLLNKANGYMVDYNPILMFCTSSHHNISLLGGTEQSNAAMLYVSPYVVKGKIELALCLAILEKTRKHIKLYPSKADDASTNISQREVQHF